MTRPLSRPRPSGPPRLRRDVQLRICRRFFFNASGEVVLTLFPNVSAAAPTENSCAWMSYSPVGKRNQFSADGV